MVLKENKCERGRERKRKLKRKPLKSSGFQATPPSAIQMLKPDLWLHVTVFILTEPKTHTHTCFYLAFLS